ncbi:MAG: hypothetical protein IT359_04590 [Gemmatimonadaceae bacterium]|nr:hypothetical protein [Gemmatimonadaceae bacterium]
MRRVARVTGAWRTRLASVVGGAGVVVAPWCTALAQVSTVTTATPALSPVGLWQTAAAGSGPAAAANTLSLRINSGAVQSLPSIADNALNTFPSPVSITTQWDVSMIIGYVDLVGYFATPTAALTGPAATLPSSRVLGRMSTGRATAFTGFTGSAVNGVGTAGASLHLYRQLIIGPFNGVGQRTDNLELQLDLRGLLNLAAGTYTGTLTLRAIAY